jgi:hypothetical protein
MTGVKRRLTIYPSQVSLVFNLRQAEQFYYIFTHNLDKVHETERPVVQAFLDKMQNCIITGKRLAKKSLITAKEGKSSL